MNKEILKQIILDQHGMGLPKSFVHREALSKAKALMSDPFIVIIKGVRRCGKSTILQWIRTQCKQRDYYVNFDDDRLVNFQLKDFQLLYEVFIELYGEQKTFFFDEVQNIPEWERFIRRLHDHEHKIYITGSNATMLSEELGSRLTGRYLAITVYPYSFKEYIYFKYPKLKIEQRSTKDKVRVIRSFNDYIEDGGFPEFVKYKNTDYLHTLYENILYKDIITRFTEKRNTHSRN